MSGQKVTKTSKDKQAAKSRSTKLVRVNSLKKTQRPRVGNLSKRISSRFSKNKTIIIVGAFVIAAVIGLIALNHKSYEEYDLKGLTVKEACEKARSAGWSARVIADQGDDKTDCYNDKYTVSKYTYGSYCNGCVTIYYDGSEIEKQKKEKCEADGKWYRDGRCRSQEEWENDYAWENAHAACKKYGSSGYAKTLTDCYLHGEYVGPVASQPTSSTPQATSSNTAWRQVLADYESWMNKYIDFMVKYKNTSDYSARASMISDYSALVSEMTEWTEKLNNTRGELSTSDLTEYIQTLTRINQRLSELY